MKRLSVVGFGLIGGSFALSQRRRAPTHVTAVDLPAVLAHPRASHVADALVDANDRAGVAQALAASDLVLLAVPVRVICGQLPSVLSVASLVTDTGSTKRAVQAAARACPGGKRFVPGHPMAGLPEGGLDHARADLFDGRPWILCGEEADADALREVELWASNTGAKVVRLASSEHDAAVARTSHLPQLVASALVQIVSSARAKAAGGPAFERLVRTAGGPEAMWRDIFATNADEIARALEELMACLGPIAGELAATSESSRAEALLRAARSMRAELGSNDALVAPASERSRK